MYTGKMANSAAFDKKMALFYNDLGPQGFSF